MKTTYFIGLFFSLLLLSVAATGQTRFSTRNQSLIDVEKEKLGRICTNFGSSVKKRRPGIRHDLKRIGFLNVFCNSELTKDQILAGLSKFFRSPWKLDSLNLGGVTRYETRIFSEGYLEIYLSFSTFADAIVFKRVYFSSRNYTDCLQPYKNGISLQDLLYLEKYCIPIIDFPISWTPADTYFSWDTCFSGKLASLPGAPYKFFLSPAQHELNRMTWFSYDSYQFEHIPGLISEWTRGGNDSLYQLLFSPNHILALYAMEALTYLKETNRVSPAPEMLEKMEQLALADIPIRVQYSDVILPAARYKNIKPSKQQILAKFKRLSP